LENEKPKKAHKFIKKTWKKRTGNKAVKVFGWQGNK
jgi:hypothetical protein